MRAAGLIVAAGRGQRLGDATPKQYLDPRRTARCSAARSPPCSPIPAVETLRVVIHPDDRALYAAAVRGIADPRLGPPVAGGATRADASSPGSRRSPPTPPTACSSTTRRDPSSRST